MGRVRNSTLETQSYISLPMQKHTTVLLVESSWWQESSVREWCRLKYCLQKLHKQKKAECQKSAKFPELEHNLVAWIAQVRQQGIAISTTELWQSLLPENYISLTSEPQKARFTASYTDTSCPYPDKPTFHIKIWTVLGVVQDRLLLFVFVFLNFIINLVMKYISLSIFF